MIFKDFEVEPVFGQYASTGFTSLIFEESGEDGGVLPVTVNVPGAFIPNDECIIVNEYGIDTGSVAELIRLGWIEPERVTQVRTGMVVVPVHKLTDTALAIRDAQFRQHGIV